jgi:EAL domain-containing protein (putative c-di-GMP-specific phosphodiesterase class I)
VFSAAVENDLKNAIVNGDLYLVYQPEVNLATGAVECFEVLLRYEHPVFGNIPPDEFIPIAEKTDLIDELTVWLIEQVGEQSKQWVKSGYAPMLFAINISPVILQRNQSFMILLDAFQKGIIHPSSLEVEIPESVFLENLFDMMDKLYSLKEMGVTVSLDDFGTDYASIDYLKHLPIDKVKIDRSIIQSVFGEDGQENQAIIKSIVALEKELGILIIAVGVETQEQVSYLMAADLKYAQGYFFSKPLRASEIEQLGFLRIDSEGLEVF